MACSKLEARGHLLHKTGLWQWDNAIRVLWAEACTARSCTHLFHLEGILLDSCVSLILLLKVPAAMHHKSTKSKFWRNISSYTLSQEHTTDRLNTNNILITKLVRYLFLQEKEMVPFCDIQLYFYRLFYSRNMCYSYIFFHFFVLYNM